MSTAQAVEDRAKFDFVRYANCWEDPLLLLGAMPPRARCLSIASAGDNSFSLLCGGAASVTAFDLNRAQLLPRMRVDILFYIIRKQLEYSVRFGHLLFSFP